jgi:MoaA/NifB/PqqE/SkfB family radical SAM enzyme
MGYKTVVVSNGFGFTSSSFTGLALPYIDELIFSLHGHNADTHGQMTGNPVSFRRLMRAFENVSRENSTVGLSVNTTVTRWNLGSLLPIAGMIRRFGVRKYHCLSAIPLGRGRARFLDLSPSLQKCSATLPKLAQKCWQNNIQLLVAGFPCCVLGPYHRCSVDWSGEYVRDHVQPGKIVFEKEPGEPKNFRIDLGRIKIAKCRPCALGKVCGGISAEYYNTYGDDELSPFIVD